MRKKGRAEPRTLAPPRTAGETRFLEGLFDEPERLRERLVLAIALAPPKARRGHGLTEPGRRMGRRRV